MINKRVNDIIHFILSKWLFISISLFTTILLSLAYLLITPRNYSSLIVVQLKKTKITTQSISSLYSITGNKTQSFRITNELEFFRSENQLKEVIYKTQANISYLAPYYWSKKTLYLATPIKVEIAKNRMAEILEPVTIEIKSLKKGNYQIKAQQQSIKFSLQKELPCKLNFPFGTIQLKETNQQPKPFLIIKIEPISNTIEKIKNHLATKIISNNNGNIITARFKCDNPQKAINFLNHLVQTYNQSNYFQKQKQNLILDYYIGQRIKNIEKELNQLDSLLQKEKQEKRSINITTEITTLEKRKNNLIFQKAAQNQQINKLEFLLKSNSKKNQILTSLDIKNKGIEAQIKSYNKLFLSSKMLSLKTTKENDEIKFQKKELRQQQKQIIQTLTQYKKSLFIKKGEITTQLDQLLYSQKKIPHISRINQEIKRKKKIKLSLYHFLITEKEKKDYLTLAQLDRAKIITSPQTSPYPVYPRIKIILLVALAIGIGIPILYYIIRPFFSFTLKSKEEIKSHLNLPIIGTVPMFETKKKAFFRDRIAFIRNQLIDQSNSENGIILLVTSTIPNEGKTFISANLAKSFSLLEKKILLIDLNLNNPQIPFFLNQSKQKGITDYIEEEATKKEIITSITSSRNNLIKISGTGKLDFIQNGINPLNLNEVLLSSRLNKLLKELKKEYDYILIDAPPIGTISNTILLAQQSNRILYIIRENYSSKHTLDIIKKIVTRHNLPQTNIIINNEKTNKKTFLS